MKEQRIKESYYRKDIDPTLDNLTQIVKITENYEKHGAQRLLYALQMNHIDGNEIEDLSQYLLDAGEKMEKELKRVKKYEEKFNQEYTTDHNGYYNAVAEMLRKIRSHIAPLKTVLKKTCPRRHPNRNVCQRYNIAGKSIYNESMLGITYYHKDVFGIYNYPDEVKGLHTALKKFFKAENECFKRCIDIINEEKKIKNNPQLAFCILDKCRRRGYEKLKNMVILTNNDTLEMLKCINPLYIQYKRYASEESFASAEFHEHNTADMDHFCLIELMEKDCEFSNEEYALFGKSPDTIRKIRTAIVMFDDLLPESFKKQQIGEYQYMFCQWAAANGNIKRVNEYLTRHYHGKYKLTKYNGVNKHSRTYDKNSPKTTDFLSRINFKLNSEPYSNQKKMVAK